MPDSREVVCLPEGAALPAFTLRPLEDSDVLLVERWLEAPHVRRWFARPETWLEEISARHGKYRWITHLIACADLKSIGFCQYFDCSQSEPGRPWQHEPPGTFGIDFLIGEEEYLGEGLGTELVRHVGVAAMQDGGALRLIARPDLGNIPSIKALERNGYVLDEATGLYVWDLI